VFLAHVLAGVVCIALMPLATGWLGVLGALAVMLVARVTMTSQMVAILMRRMQSLAREAPG
jgi:hypothetical protein